MNNKAANRPILFFDSGLGGITTLLQVEKFLSNENFVYVADFKNSPYGNKNKNEIQKVLTETIYFYQKKIKPKAIVLACNTLTAILIEKVRKKYPNLIVVGAEPAIRPALQNSKKNVLVLATNATLKHSKLIKLFKTNNHSNVSFLKLPKLAGLIDEFYSTNPQVIQDYLAQNLAYLKGKFDAVVLGCTHYIIVGKAIKNILGNVTLYNGNYGITKRLMVCLDIMKIKNFGGKKGKTTLISTDEKRKEMLLKNYTYLLKRRDELCAV